MKIQWIITIPLLSALAFGNQYIEQNIEHKDKTPIEYLKKNEPSQFECQTEQQEITLEIIAGRGETEEISLDSICTNPNAEITYQLSIPTQNNERTPYLPESINNNSIYLDSNHIFAGQYTMIISAISGKETENITFNFSIINSDTIRVLSATRNADGTLSNIHSNQRTTTIEQRLRCAMYLRTQRAHNIENSRGELLLNNHTDLTNLCQLGLEPNEFEEMLRNMGYRLNEE